MPPCRSMNREYEYIFKSCSNCQNTLGDCECDGRSSPVMTEGEVRPHRHLSILSSIIALLSPCMYLEMGTSGTVCHKNKRMENSYSFLLLLQQQQQQLLHHQILLLLQQQQQQILHHQILLLLQQQQQHLLHHQILYNYYNNNNNSFFIIRF